jgi:hypothetical protein
MIALLSFRIASLPLTSHGLHAALSVLGGEIGVASEETTEPYTPYKHEVPWKKSGERRAQDIKCLKASQIEYSGSQVSCFQYPPGQASTA